MSYQVLARKWRPQNFHQLVGQNHVKQALINGLEQQRLHHAYLFTGTRGVGKTTIARIFSKSLNCEQGITAEPCGTCSTCLDIEEGRYIDLLEIDAASRTKVEDTREILDNVQYAPSRGRYKVYLIDEVHMLSKHSFNALLKTLEEPPEHVKFLLATTDPQKLPVTILSRCLQFNLSALSQDEIQQQLDTILNKEQLSFDVEALKLLAKAADGSMRDALSLTDQAIAQTNGQLKTPDIMTMLGLMDISWSQKLFVAIVCNDGEALLDVVSQLSMQNPSYTRVLDDLLALTHLILMTQLVPSAANLDDKNEAFISQVANQSSAEQIQVYYQLLLNGKKDLLWAPEAKLGFEMVLLRLLAFEPSAHVQSAPVNQNTATAQTDKTSKMANLRQLLDQPKSNTPSKTNSEPEKQVTTEAVSETDNIEQQARSIPKNNIAEQQANIQSADTVTEADINAQMQDILDNAQQLMPTAINDIHIVSQQLDSQLPGTDTEADINAQMQDVLGNAQQLIPSASDTGNAVEQHSDNQSSEAMEQAQASSVPHNPDIQRSDLAETGIQSPNVEQEEPVNVAKMMSGAQSAIARILANRNISGTGQLSSPSKVAAEQVAPVATKNETPVKKAEPQRGEVAAIQKPDIRSAKPRKKQQVHERIKSDPANLAPELLVQISGDIQQVEEVIEQVIEIPEGFVSPLSETKFAYQKDHWADIINKMELGGRIRQFALHSIYQKQDNQIFLNVDLTQQHLDSQMLRDQLQTSLSQVLNEAIGLQVQFEDTVENSPYLIQQKIDSDRLQHASEVLKQDPVVTQFVSRFDAQMDESSVRTR
ncbi:DNA polymerase III subunit gamma/tau [Pseudoalteromonas sp. C2R02]|uniref:DNA polymerase III subunit gamma/tau n=1 Tax=Pseudoalteromonas sp. C2R02 TaxID=2841565 RepID=UPI001C0A1612|nr:DNA polymerase III subunit gamma/tau [Pseudoalteromonas sp. C2R02]MBU2971290.1 DNA polymerase III subunit gamma/tau [Pseudoalteromonas sp. C2R02]